MDERGRETGGGEDRKERGEERKERRGKERVKKDERVIGQSLSMG